MLRGVFPGTALEMTRRKQIPVRAPQGLPCSEQGLEPGDKRQSFIPAQAAVPGGGHVLTCYPQAKI